MRILVALLWLAATTARADVPSVVSGKVFLEVKGNGKPAAAAPLAGIRISDGVNIVTTVEDGSYRLPIGDDPTTPQKGSRVVAVNWPSGKWPVGPWWVRLDQVTDAKNVNFSLRDDDQPLPFAFLHVSDDHSAGWPYNTFGPAVAKLKPLVRFLINTGDTGDCAVTAKNAAKFPVPVMSVPGNHDIVNHGPQRFEGNPLAGNGGFTKSLGPVRWSFGYADVHVVGLDWMDPAVPVTVNGNVPQVAAEWLEKDLALVKPGTRTFVFVHFPTGCDKYYEVISKYKVAHVFGGHNHTHRYYHEFAGIPAVTAVNFIAGGNLIVVGKDEFSLGEFCLGCKSPGQHMKRCSLSRAPASLASFASMPGLADLKLPSASTTVPASNAKGVQIAVELEPGTASKAGLRIGTGPAAVEIAWTGREILIAGVPVPFAWEESDRKALLWSVTLAGGRLEFYGNKRYHLGKAIQVEQAGPVTFFAEGGEATIKRAAVSGK